MLKRLANKMAGGGDKFEERNACCSQTNQPWIRIGDTFGRRRGSLPWSMVIRGVVIFLTKGGQVESDVGGWTRVELGG